MKATDKPYLVIGAAHNWGCGTTLKDAIKEAHKNAYMGRKEYEAEFIYMDPAAIDTFWVDAMGRVNWEWNEDAKGENTMGRTIRALFNENHRLGRFSRKKNGRFVPIDEKGVDTTNNRKVV